MLAVTIIHTSHARAYLIEVRYIIIPMTINTLFVVFLFIFYSAVIDSTDMYSGKIFCKEASEVPK